MKKWYNTKELEKAMKVTALVGQIFEFKKFLKKGVHYFGDGHSRYSYDLGAIKKDFPYLFNKEKKEKYSLKNIEDYLSSKEIRYIFKIRGRSTSLKEFQPNKHYYRITHSSAVYDWDNITQGLRLTPEQHERFEHVAKKRKGKRRFSLLYNIRWQNIREAVGNHNINDIIPSDVMNPQEYLHEKMREDLMNIEIEKDLKNIKESIEKKNKNDIEEKNNIKNDIEEKNNIKNVRDLDKQVLTAIYQSRYKAIHGHLYHKDYIHIINRNRSKSLRISPQKIGWITKRLGFNKYENDGRGIYYNEDLIKNLAEKMGIVLNSVKDPVKDPVKDSDDLVTNKEEKTDILKYISTLLEEIDKGKIKKSEILEEKTSKMENFRDSSFKKNIILELELEY